MPRRYSRNALLTDEGLDGYLGLAAWNRDTDPFLADVAGRGWVVTEMNIMEHSGGGLRLSWAHALHVASTVFSLLDLNCSTQLIHVLSGPNAGYPWPRRNLL